MGIIFRGQGLRISPEEKRGWHPDVHVRFQPKAWADAEYCELHAAEEMREATASARGRNEQSVCFYDNLHGQTTDEHEKILLTKARCVRHLLPGGVTAEIQLIDDGVGYAVKSEMGYALDNWLEEDDNLNMWTGDGPGSFPMWKKRVLITQFAAVAWETVCQRCGAASPAACITCPHPPPAPPPHTPHHTTPYHTTPHHTTPHHTTPHHTC
jgi:hypothetical protein